MHSFVLSKSSARLTIWKDRFKKKIQTCSENGLYIYQTPRFVNQQLYDFLQFPLLNQNLIQRAAPLLIGSSLRGELRYVKFGGRSASRIMPEKVVPGL